jgi:hypothetical protein
MWARERERERARARQRRRDAPRQARGDATRPGARGGAIALERISAIGVAAEGEGLKRERRARAKERGVQSNPLLLILSRKTHLKRAWRWRRLRESVCACVVSPGDR